VRVDQVVPALTGRDAVGEHTLNVRRALREAGVESEIFYGSAGPDTASDGRPISALGRGPRDRVLLYQASIGSPVFDTLMARPEPKLANYHNITPAELLWPWAPQVAYEAALGRAQLERMAPHCRFAIADSRFNEDELRDAGYARTAVVPPLIDMTPPATEPDAALCGALLDAKQSGGVDLLYVGRLSPHKAPHDLVKMLAVFRRHFDPCARLHLVGAPLGDRYGEALSGLVHDLGLVEAVTMPGPVSATGLEAYWRCADAYVCASEHEGFCVPLVEAMGHGVPVVAYGAAAVPETVGDAGLVLTSKEPLRFAVAVSRVLEDPALRAHLEAAARRRVAELGLPRSSARFAETVLAALRA
jgi:glycosyltransferase involved in cell wall biosynthesis